MTLTFTSRTLTKTPLCDYVTFVICDTPPSLPPLYVSYMLKLLITVYIWGVVGEVFGEGERHKVTKHPKSRIGAVR